MNNIQKRKVKRLNQQLFPRPSSSKFERENLKNRNIFNKIRMIKSNGFTEKSQKEIGRAIHSVSDPITNYQALQVNKTLEEIDLEINSRKFRRRIDSKSAHIVNKIGHDLFKIKELSDSTSFCMLKQHRSKSFDKKSMSNNDNGDKKIKKYVLETENSELVHKISKNFKAQRYLDSSSFSGTRG